MSGVLTSARSLLPAYLTVESGGGDPPAARAKAPRARDPPSRPPEEPLRAGTAPRGRGGVRAGARPHRLRPRAEDRAAAVAVARALAARPAGALLPRQVPAPPFPLRRLRSGSRQPEQLAEAPYGVTAAADVDRIVPLEAEIRTQIHQHVIAALDRRHRAAGPGAEVQLGRGAAGQRSPAALQHLQLPVDDDG